MLVAEGEDFATDPKRHVPDDDGHRKPEFGVFAPTPNGHRADISEKCPNPRRVHERIQIGRVAHVVHALACLGSRWALLGAKAGVLESHNVLRGSRTITLGDLRV